MTVELMWKGKAARRPPAAATLRTVERVPADGRRGGAPNLLIHGDNLAVAAALKKTHAGCVDLLYVDPPFLTGAEFALQPRATERGGAAKRKRVAYRDRWDGPAAYLDAMAARLHVFRDLLSDRGTIFLHCDWHASHWLRCLLDETFGVGSFKNEIVWRYRRWPAKTRVFQRMHDVLFWYGKSESQEHAFETLYEPLAPSTLATFGTKKQVADFSSGRRKPGQLDTESPGAPLSDVWDIGIVAPIARERRGYPTQKPEALLDRIVRAASRPGDLVADLFCGSGTTLAVAERLGRRWIGCDAGEAAVETSRRRLLEISPRASFEIADATPKARAASSRIGARLRPAATARGVSVELRKSGDVDAWDLGTMDGDVFVRLWGAHRARAGGELETTSPEIPHAGSLVARLAVTSGRIYTVAVRAPDVTRPTR